MFETLGEKAEEKAMVQFLERFTDYPFLVKFKNSEYPIGEGEPTFTVNFKKTIPLAELLKSTSLALGEAYMRGDLDIEGNLYEALDHFLGQMSKFSTNESALKRSCSVLHPKRIRKRKSPATMISEMIFINYGWTKP